MIGYVSSYIHPQSTIPDNDLVSTHSRTEERPHDRILLDAPDRRVDLADARRADATPATVTIEVYWVIYVSEILCPVIMFGVDMYKALTLIFSLHPQDTPGTSRSGDEAVSRIDEVVFLRWICVSISDGHNGSSIVFSETLNSDSR